MASSIDNSAWLQWMTNLLGGVSRQTYAATLPPDRYYCLLDELPLHLIPQRYQDLLHRENGQSLRLNPECILRASGEVPHELESQKDLLSGFALQGPMAWVRSESTGNFLPFWLGPQLADALNSILPGKPLPSSISQQSQSVLAAAGILISKTPDRNANANETNSAIAASQFREKGYAPVADLIHPFHIAALRRYYRFSIRTGAIRLGDGQSSLRYVAYNDPVARFFHRDITTRLSAVAGEPLKPSYVYLASYLSGAELKKHTDREQCEFSITLCLDFSPEPALATSWPIRLDTAKGTVTVYQALGDGLAYRGTRLPHYRDRLKDRQTSTSIFFHYVGVDFAGSLD